MTRLLQRYKYLKKGLEEEMKKILKFLKAFEDSERRSLAIYTGLLLSEVLVPASVLASLLRYMCNSSLASVPGLPCLRLRAHFNCVWAVHA